MCVIIFMIIVYKLICATTYSFLLLMCMTFCVFGNLCIRYILFLLQLVLITNYAFVATLFFNNL